MSPLLEARELAGGDRIAAQEPISWEEFTAVNADLFDWPNTTLSQM